jgi:aerobic carbon-monoxide dehydrogenase small subunit
MTAVTLNLNGVKIAVDVEPRQTLADFLRDLCSLTATHLGCEHGACGACTVEVDGQATRSCLVLAVMCDGRSVFTLEGLRSDPAMAVLRKHFHESHALQCGFCTPGMLIMARDILQRIPKADAQKVRHELSGQICRCTGYANIVKAIVAAGEEMALAEEPTLERVFSEAEAEAALAALAAEAAAQAAPAGPPAQPPAAESVPAEPMNAEPSPSSKPLR